MGSEILTPFQLDANGQVLAITDPSQQIEQHIDSLVSTQPGERVMLPDYGVPTNQWIFNLNSDPLMASMIQIINAAMATWEPTVQVESIQFGGNEDPSDYQLQVQIDWSGGGIQSTSSDTGIQTATVLVGGTVVEDSNSA